MCPAGRPECLLNGAADEWGGPFFVLATLRLGMLATLFLLILVIGLAERLRHRLKIKSLLKNAQQLGLAVLQSTKQLFRSGRISRVARDSADERHHRNLRAKEHQKTAHRRDRLELVESIVFGMQLIASLKITLQFFSMPERGGTLGNIGLVTLPWLYSLSEPFHSVPGTHTRTQHGLSCWQHHRRQVVDAFSHRSTCFVQALAIVLLLYQGVIVTKYLFGLV